MELDNKGMGVLVTSIGSLVLINVDVAHGSGVYGACLFAVNTPLTIKGGQFSGCQLTEGDRPGGAIAYALEGASTSKGLFSKTKFINNTGDIGGAERMHRSRCVLAALCPQRLGCSSKTLCRCSAVHERYQSHLPSCQSLLIHMRLRIHRC